MSPYSWFAAERIDALIPAAHWCPVFAGALFRANDRTSWGLTERRAERIADCEARARSHGLGPIRWPDPWPTSDLLVARAMVFAERRGLLRSFALTAMRAAFLEGGDLGDLAVVKRAAERVGLNAGDVAAAADGVDIKDALRTNTGRAVELGVVGVPTVAIGQQLFWGDDRLEDAAQLAVGQR